MPMTTKTLIGLLAAPLMMTGCTSASDSPQTAGSQQEGKDCFFLSQVNGFTSAKRDRVLVNVGVNDVYEFQTMGSCPDLNFSEAIAFDKNGPGQICRGIDVDLIVPTAIGPQRCPVSMIRKLSPAETGAN